MEPEPSTPRWTEPELAWPLALLGGFAGTWLGLSTGLAGAAAVLATLAFAPLHAGLLARGLAHRAALVACGWMGGIAVATAGVAIEHGLGPTLRGLPLARDWSALHASTALAQGGAPTSDTWPLAAAAAGLALPALLALLARFGAGVLALLGLALAAGAAAGGSGFVALALVERGRQPFQAVALSWPPHAVAVLLAAALWTTAAAARRPWDPTPAAPRSLAVWGAVLLALGTLGELLGHGPWLRWVMGLARA